MKNHFQKIQMKDNAIINTRIEATIRVLTKMPFRTALKLNQGQEKLFLPGITAEGEKFQKPFPSRPGITIA